MLRACSSSCRSCLTISVHKVSVFYCISLLTEVSQAARKWERRETSAGPLQVLWCTIIRNFGWNQTGFEIPVFRNPGNALIAHVQIYWLLELLRAHAKTDLPRSRLSWLKCHSLPWDAGACSIWFLPGTGRGLSPLSHFLAPWETSVSRKLVHGRRRELFQCFSSVFYRTIVPTTVLKICVEIGERFSCCLLSSQKPLYKTACSTALEFWKQNRIIWTDAVRFRFCYCWPRENEGTERDTQGVGQDMSIPLKFFIIFLV